MDLIPSTYPSAEVLNEINVVEAQLQKAFPLNDIHVLLDVDGRAEVWAGDTALGVKWASADPSQLIGLPASITPKKLTDILYEMISTEVAKVLTLIAEKEHNNEDDANS